MGCIGKVSFPLPVDINVNSSAVKSVMSLSEEKSGEGRVLFHIDRCGDSSSSGWREWVDNWETISFIPPLPASPV